MRPATSGRGNFAAKVRRQRLKFRLLDVQGEASSWGEDAGDRKTAAWRKDDKMGALLACRYATRLAPTFEKLRLPPDPLILPSQFSMWSEGPG